MSAVFCESYEALSANGAVGKYQANALADSRFNTTAGRFGRGAQSDLAGLRTQQFTPRAEWFFTTAFRPQALTSRSLIRFWDGGTQHVDIRMDGMGRLVATRGDGAQIGSPSANALTVGVYYSLGVRCVIDDASGIIEARINGSSTGWLNMSSVDTRNGGNPTANNFDWCIGSAGGDLYYDDTLINDAVSSGTGDLVSFPGDVRVECLYPTGAGSSTDFTPSTGSNWQNVDDPQTDGDSTYNESATVGHRDMFQMGNLVTGTGTVLGLQACAIARKTDSNTRTIALSVRLGTTNYNSPAFSVSNTYSGFTYMWTLDPTNNQWTIANVNAAEGGYTVIS
jgi:hypothetical protein